MPKLTDHIHCPSLIELTLDAMFYPMFFTSRIHPKCLYVVRAYLFAYIGFEYIKIYGQVEEVRGGQVNGTLAFLGLNC